MRDRTSDVTAAPPSIPRLPARRCKPARNTKKKKREKREVGEGDACEEREGWNYMMHDRGFYHRTLSYPYNRSAHRIANSITRRVLKTQTWTICTTKFNYSAYSENPNLDHMYDRIQLLGVLLKNPKPGLHLRENSITRSTPWKPNTWNTLTSKFNNSYHMYDQIQLLGVLWKPEPGSYVRPNSSTRSAPEKPKTWSRLHLRENSIIRSTTSWKPNTWNTLTSQFDNSEYSENPNLNHTHDHKEYLFIKAGVELPKREERVLRQRYAYYFLAFWFVFCMTGLLNAYTSGNPFLGQNYLKLVLGEFWGSTGV